MDAKPYLETIAAHFHDVGLDAVMIGNAAAAINGAPVTTLDIDFMVKQTADNYRKLAVLAQQMDCQFIEMKLPGDNYMYRLVQQRSQLVIDVLFSPAGIRDFKSLKANSIEVSFGGHSLRVASLRDILASKKAAGRPKDLASIPILEMTLREKDQQHQTH